MTPRSFAANATRLEHPVVVFRFGGVPHGLKGVPVVDDLPSPVEPEAVKMERATTIRRCARLIRRFGEGRLEGSVEHLCRLPPPAIRSPPLRELASSSTSRETRQEEPRMGRIVVSDNVSLDGVIQDPAGDEGFRRGGWVGLIRDRPEANQLALDEALDAEALLLGRRSYEWMAGRWPSRSGELANRLNSMPKYVVSSTLGAPHWTNSTVLRGDVVREVSQLKQELTGDIVVVASFQLVRTLLEQDLVDELRLKVYPVVLGAGERLFRETSDKKPMRLVDTQTIDGDVAYLTYESVKDRGAAVSGKR
jgi:dihydrofolate reductase